MARAAVRQQVGLTALLAAKEMVLVCGSGGVGKTTTAAAMAVQAATEIGGRVLVLTVDPLLQAYRTDRIAGVEQSCPKPDGDVICDQVSYAPWLNFTPPAATAAATTEDEGGSNGLLFVLIALVVVVVGIGAWIVIRRRRADREAIEV